MAGAREDDDYDGEEEEQLNLVPILTQPTSYTYLMTIKFN